MHEFRTHAVWFLIVAGVVLAAIALNRNRTDLSASGSSNGPKPTARRSAVSVNCGSFALAR